VSTAVRLERIPYDADAWDAIVAAHPEAEVFHGAPWFDFLSATQGAEPVVAVVQMGGRPVGYFAGAIVQRYGIRILGSPLRGWSTQCMGFLLEDGVDRRAAAEALPQLAFGELGCLHVELADRHLTGPQMEGASYEREPGTTLHIDLTGSEEEILNRFRKTSRWEIRRALRIGLQTEIAADEAFVDEYYGFLLETFHRQGLAPTYGPDRVRSLIDALRSTGQLVLLRVRAPDGRVLATSLSVGRGRTAVLWGIAFDRSERELHPVDLLWWDTIRAWRAAGAERFDVGGGGNYKAKYGGFALETVHLHRSRWPVLNVARSTVRGLVRTRQRVARKRSTTSRSETDVAV
jgi:CelD/BcsL family acetyltransferase involved in cellulose biosynthesis